MNNENVVVEEQKVFTGDPIECSVADTPLDVSSINISPNKCLLNSYNVAVKHKECSIIEGIAVIQFSDGFIPFVHCWNKIGKIYFDVTKDSYWNELKLAEKPRKVRYFRCYEYLAYEANIVRTEKGEDLSFKYNYDYLLDYFKKKGKNE